MTSVNRQVQADTIRAAALQLAHGLEGLAKASVQLRDGIRNALEQKTREIYMQNNPGKLQQNPGHRSSPGLRQ